MSQASALYAAMQELVHSYQLRDRDRACYGSVTPNECYAIEALERSGRLSVNELAAALALHKSNASRLADALVEKGLVGRSADPRDGRARSLEVTARGRAVHAAIRRGVERRYRRVLARVAPATRAELVQLVHALAAEAAERIGCAPARRPARPAKAERRP